MSTLGTYLSKNKISVIRSEKTTFPDGTTKVAPLCYVPLSLKQSNPKNNRFRSQEGLSAEEHSRLLRAQNPSNFSALVKSIKDQPCFEAVKIHYKDGKLFIIDGHRRIEAARESGRDDFLAIIYEDLTEEQFDFVAEWNEENPTKLPHEAFYKARGIALPIITAKTEEEREKVLTRLKRRNIKQSQIDRAVNTILYIKDFAERTGEAEEKRSDQYKAFETVALTKQDTFQTLRNIGDFEKIERLDNLAVDFLKANLAHDDIKVALDGLAQRDLNDITWIKIIEKDFDTEKTSDLRRIVNEIRLNNSNSDLLAETKAFSQRLYGKLLKEPDSSLIDSLKEEVNALIEKLNILSDSCGGLQ